MIRLGLEHGRRARSLQRLDRSPKAAPAIMGVDPSPLYSTDSSTVESHTTTVEASKPKDSMDEKKPVHSNGELALTRNFPEAMRRSQSDTSLASPHPISVGTLVHKVLTSDRSPEVCGCGEEIIPAFLLLVSHTLFVVQLDK